MTSLNFIVNHNKHYFAFKPDDQPFQMIACNDGIKLQTFITRLVHLQTKYKYKYINVEKSSINIYGEQVYEFRPNLSNKNDVYDLYEHNFDNIDSVQFIMDFHCTGMNIFLLKDYNLDSEMVLTINGFKMIEITNINNNDSIIDYYNDIFQKS
jgi:hypothetical protein